MDWRSILEERNKRAAQNNYGSFSPTSIMATIKPLGVDNSPEADPGFFGNLANGAGAVAGFFGDMVKDVGNKAQDAIQGTADIIGGFGAQDRLNALEAKRRKEVVAKGDEADYLKRLNEWNAAHRSELDAARGDMKKSQDVDTTKTAAAAAETFLNVAGGAGLVKGIAKGVVKQGAKMVGKELFKKSAETVAKNTAKSAAEAAIKQTGKGALKTIGRNALEGGLLGAGYGALQPVYQSGNDAKIGDIWQQALVGGGLGGVLGGAGTLLDKNVRAGVREIPGMAKKGAKAVVDEFNPTAIAMRNPEVLALEEHAQMLDQQRSKLLNQGLSENSAPLINNRKAYASAMAEKQRVIRGIKEGGYIRIPGKADAIDTATNAAETARKQLAGEAIDGPITGPNEQFIQAEAARVSSPQAYEKEMVDYIWQNNKKGAGVEFINNDNMFEPGATIKRMSNNTPFYQAFYKEYGHKPTKTEITNLVKDYLGGADNIAKYEIMPEQRDVYSILKDNEIGLQRSMEVGPPEGLYSQFSADLGMPGQTTPKAPGRTSMAQTATVPPQSFEQSQRALMGQAAAETNPLIDYIDPQTIPSPQTRFGVQTGLPDNPNPYAGMTADPNRLALPMGEIPTVSPAAGKRAFKTGADVPEILNKKKAGSQTFELPATTAEGENLALRQTKGGKLKPFKLVSKDEINAIRSIAEDDTSSAFTTMRTPEMNLAEAFKKRGGEAAPEFKVLQQFDTGIREHTANLVADIQEKRGFLEDFMKRYKVDGKSANAMRPYLEAADDFASNEALTEYAKKFGDQAAVGLQELRAWWRATAAETRNSTNAVIKQFAGEKKMMGDLGETYLPRVYKSGKPGFKDSVLDLVHGKMDAIGGKDGLFNLKNGTGYLSKETETMGGILRNSEGIPLNSEFAKPNTTFLSAAQKRTAKAPIRELEDPITSMMRYFEATGRAKYYTPDIAKGQELRDAIQLVNNDTNNLRQMYKSFEDQINSLAGKTSRIDRPFVDSAAGAKFVSVANKVQSKIARSTIIGSASSAFAQTGQLPLIAAENGTKNFAGGMSDIVKYIRSKGSNDPMKLSSLMKARYPKYEDMFKVTKSGKLGNKATDVIAKPFRVVEYAASELGWRSSYRKALETGLTGKKAIQEADRITAKIIGERSAGARAAVYESKALSPITSYTLEVNQLYQVAKQYFKNDPKKAMKLVGAIWLYNQGYQAVTGNKLNADPLAAAGDAAGILTKGYDEAGNPIGLGERLIRASGRLAGEAIDATPLGGPVVGNLYPENGFRIPFGGGARTLSQADVFGDTNFGRYGGGTPIASGISNPLLMLGIPGMSQLQRSVEGNAAYNKGSSVSPSGTQRFTINQDPENYWRSLLFGMYNTKEGRAYLASQNANLGR